MSENNFEEEIEFNIRPRPSETISISIPKTAMISLQKIAETRDMSVQALIKFYIGQCLRSDWDEFFPDVTPETTKEILSYRSREKAETMVEKAMG